MTCENVLPQAIAVLQLLGCVSYRTLAWRFASTRTTASPSKTRSLPHLGFCHYTSRWRVEEKGTVPAEDEGTRADMEEGHHALSTVSACESCGSTVL